MTDSEELISSQFPSVTSTSNRGEYHPRSRRNSEQQSKSQRQSRSPSSRSPATGSCRGQSQPGSPTDSRYLSRATDLKNLPRDVIMNLSYGAKFNCCMSTIRKYFCIFALLDLVVHSVVYLQYLKHADDFTLKDLIECQMKCYDIRSSFIDILLLSIGRFILLETAYGVVRDNSWVVTALTTAMTSVFIVVKPLHYDWENECQRMWPVSMMILSFVWAWLEAFLVNFRLLGMETLARRYCDARPETFRKDLPRIGVIRAFFPITFGLFRSVLVRSDSMTLFPTRSQY